jgi:chromosome segregation ATPase
MRPTSPSMRPVSSSLRPSSRAAPHPSIPPGTFEPAPSFPPESGALASVARYHQKLAQLQEQLADAQRELSLTNQERASEAEQLDELGKQVLVLRHRATELESALGVQHELRAAQKDREEELEKEIVALRETLEDRLVDRDLELARLRGEVVTVRELKATRSRELVAVRATAEAKDARVHDLEIANASMKRDLDKLRTEMARNLSEQLALSAELRVAREEARRLREISAAVAGLLGGFDEIAGAIAALRERTAEALEEAAPPDRSAPKPASDD